MEKVDGGGKRFNKGKLRVDLVPTELITQAAEVFGFGAEKYGDKNWERGMSWTTVYACMLRHIIAWKNKEDNDPESGLSHLGHVACNLAMLLEYAKTYKEGDDR